MAMTRERVKANGKIKKNWNIRPLAVCGEGRMFSKIFRFFEKQLAQHHESSF